MLRHNFEINKPMFEMAGSVRFTEYLRSSLNRCLQTSIFPHQLQGSTIRKS